MRFLFFFFQAEDGIRDYKVTGVQTCALPIWLGSLFNMYVFSPGVAQTNRRNTKGVVQNHSSSKEYGGTKEQYWAPRMLY